MKQKNTNLIWLTESAIMIALSTILSLIKIFDLPYGGSITAGSMLPIVIIAYRYGTAKGLITGLAYSVIQLIFGLGSVSYATSWVAGVAIIMLDYIIAFTVTGLGGIFRKKTNDNQTSSIIFGALLVCILRYICHIISGCTVWAGVSIPSSDGLIYSVSYNATYMIPETIIVLLLAWYLTGIIDFSSATLRPIKKDSSRQSGLLPYALITGGFACLTVAIIFDVVSLFGSLQNPESGELDFSLISNADLTSIGIVSAAGILLMAVLLTASVIIKNKRKK